MIETKSVPKNAERKTIKWSIIKNFFDILILCQSYYAEGGQEQRRRGKKEKSKKCIEILERMFSLKKKE